jgi:hypothetical protein
VGLLAGDELEALLLDLLDVARTADEHRVAPGAVEVAADATADGPGAVDDVTHALCSFPVPRRRRPCRRPRLAGSL